MADRCVAWTAALAGASIPWYAIVLPGALPGLVLSRRAAQAEELPAGC